MDVNKNLKILIVDDFATMRKVIRNLLKQGGFENVAEAEDGAAAFKLLKAVRADEELKELPFLMVTAEALKDNVVAAVKAGVSNYIVKPFTAEVLNEKIEKIVKNLAA
jgi:two-component system chemotaxis response regulator CheY